MRKSFNESESGWYFLGNNTCSFDTKQIRYQNKISNDKRIQMAEMTPSELLRSMSTELSLQFEPQDWGIFNADPNRLEEFLSFYENNHSLHLTQKYHLCELIIASFNEAMIEKRAPQKVLNKFIRFVSSIKKVHSAQIQYWSSLEASDEFPVAQVLLNVCGMQLNQISEG